MVLGTLAEETGLYGGKDVTVKPDGRNLSEAFTPYPKKRRAQTKRKSITT